MNDWLEQLELEGSEPSETFYEECLEVMQIRIVIEKDISRSNPLTFASYNSRNKTMERMEEQKTRHEKMNNGRRVICEMALCRVVDNYMIYICNMVALIFKTDPRTMRSDGTLPYADILKHTSMDELVATIAEREVDKLAGDLEKLNTYIIKTFNLNLFGNSPEVFEEAMKYNELRNLIVHKRGTIDRRFKGKVKKDYGEIGDRILVLNEMTRAISLFSRVVNAFDAEAVKKYNLPILPRSVLRDE
jgi:hypothetical protein